MNHASCRIAAGAVALIVLSGRGVQRRLTVNSEPPGALVYLNDREAGRTPFTTDIGWYGRYDVVVRKDGFETLKTQANVPAPWWQYPPIDLLAELAPWKPEDRQFLSFKLEQRPAEGVSAQALIDHGLEMKLQLPATQPSR